MIENIKMVIEYYLFKPIEFFWFWLVFLCFSGLFWFVVKYFNLSFNRFISYISVIFWLCLWIFFFIDTPFLEIDEWRYKNLGHPRYQECAKKVTHDNYKVILYHYNTEFVPCRDEIDRKLEKMFEEAEAKRVEETPTGKELFKRNINL